MIAFADTNILLYAVSLAPDEQDKRKRAEGLLDRGGIALSVQVLQEFFVQATNVRRQPSLSSDDAWAYTSAWRRFPVQETSLALLDAGAIVHRRTRFSWWDSMIVAAAIAQGCDTLWTEDMQDGRIFDGLRIRNPFRD